MNITTHETERIRDLQRQLHEAEQFRQLVRDMRTLQRSRLRDDETREMRARVQSAVDRELGMLDSE